MGGKKFVFCGDWVGGKTMGVHRYALQILLEMDRLLETDDRLSLELLVPADSHWESPFRSIRVVPLGLRGREGTAARKILSRLWRQLVFPAYAMLHGGRGVDLTLAMPSRGLCLCAIHDCIRERFYAEDKSAYQRRYLRRVRRITANDKVRIVTVSEYSRREIMELYPVSGPRIRVIGNGWEHMERINEDETVLKRLGLAEGREYFFSLGSKEPHKNMDWVVRTARRNPQYRFVLTGEAFGWEAAREENILFTGYLADNEMKALMTHCKAFLQPSFCEGFGIPPLEALSLGRPVICANTSCLPEIYKDSVRYIDPRAEGCDLEELLSRPVASPEPILREHSWKNAGERMYALLREIDKEG